MTGERLATPASTPIMRGRRSTSWTIPANTQWVLAFDTIDEDTDGMSNPLGTVNLTGTVAKTSGVNTLTGTGTAFSTELLVGQQIQVGAEIRTVQTITSATALTVDVNWGTSLSGATAARMLSDHFTAQRAGIYSPSVAILWPTAGSGYRELVCVSGSGTSNTASTVGAEDRPVTSSSLWTNVTFRPVRLAPGDFVRFEVWQNSGGSLAVTVGSYYPSGHLVRMGA